MKKHCKKILPNYNFIIYLWNDARIIIYLYSEFGQPLNKLLYYF